MAGLTLDCTHTILRIADLYAAILPTLPHAVDRQVVAKTQPLQYAAHDTGRQHPPTRSGARSGTALCGDPEAGPTPQDRGREDRQG